MWNCSTCHESNADTATVCAACQAARDPQAGLTDPPEDAKPADDQPDAAPPAMEAPADGDRIDAAQQDEPVPADEPAADAQEKPPRTRLEKQMTLVLILSVLSTLLAIAALILVLVRQTPAARSDEQTWADPAESAQAEDDAYSEYMDERIPLNCAAISGETDSTGMEYFNMRVHAAEGSTVRIISSQVLEGDSVDVGPGDEITLQVPASVFLPDEPQESEVVLVRPELELTTPEGEVLLLELQEMPVTVPRLSISITEPAACIAFAAKVGAPIEIKGRVDETHVPGFYGGPFEVLLNGEPIFVDDLGAFSAVYPAGSAQAETGADGGPADAAPEDEYILLEARKDNYVIARQSILITYSEEFAAKMQVEQSSAADYVGLVFSATGLGGETVSDASIRGAKLTMVNYWATWCGPCLYEMPTLERLYRNYADKGLLLIGIQLDGENAAGARDVMQEYGISYPLIPYDYELDALAGEPFEYIPTTVFLDQNGRRLGEMYNSAKEYDEWAAIIDDLLAQLS